MLRWKVVVFNRRWGAKEDRNPMQLGELISRELELVLCNPPWAAMAPTQAEAKSESGKLWIICQISVSGLDEQHIVSLICDKLLCRSPSRTRLGAYHPPVLEMGFPPLVRGFIHV